MQSIQEVFARIAENKKKLKDLRTSLKNALSNSMSYQDLTEQMKKLRDKRKQVESEIRGQFAKEIQEMEDLKIDVDSDIQVLSDIALTSIMKGEQVEIKDEYDNAYEPILKVTFKKAA